ncbi:hypothetical protein JL720_14983 [Aureococcus anophagefferens]|nr:hypothetical protein JL720_14983 [Aureococcus anophagefferens]
MASRLGRRRATQFQSRWVAEYPARAQRLAVMVQRLVREPPSGRGALCDVARLRAELETRTAALERQARCYELDVAAAKATLLVSHRSTSRGSGPSSRKADADAARAAAAAELEATDRALAKTKRTLAARERELKDCKQEAKRACHLADRSRDELARVRVVHKQGVKAAREEERAVADRLASSYAHKVEGLWWLVGVQRRVAADAAKYAEASRKAHKALVDDLRDLGGDDGFADREPEFREAPRDRLRRIFRARVASRCSVARVANDYGLAPDIRRSGTRQAFSPVTPAPPGDRFAEALRDVANAEAAWEAAWEDGAKMEKAWLAAVAAKKELAEDRRAKRLAAVAIPTQTERPRVRNAVPDADPTSAGR